ncbi:acetyltransferase (GNAT) family protein [Plesiocystis pacifica SIR-1]|uniref:Acetyltransferase (GNAT) family protein n=1 Tax=Plesiocystis pacifica SIR-1 TaxID=391625 RepID=A6G5J3_9BACT|nr:GNAT family N-acetyltransferase [Plesiocystis pacifica]EDM78936.1 acetyltransferase (GNAT) family protein [Plesiocystis pacifica SIR-1]
MLNSKLSDDLSPALLLPPTPPPLALGGDEPRLDALMAQGQSVTLELGAGARAQLRDEPYSDRVRCDHPRLADEAQARELGLRLLEQAQARGRGRVVVLAPVALEAGFAAEGFRREGLMPSFYRGEQDCAVLGAYPDQARARLADPWSVAEVLSLIEHKGGSGRQHAPVETRRAEVEDAPGIAALLDGTFTQYPTPSGDAAYIAEAIEGGTPFRLIEADGDPVACASADLIPSAQTAELTDCATLPSHRGRGYMQFILEDLMDDLRGLDYPTAFTLARASVPGINLAFSRLGFDYQGTMPQSCRIGGGIEDMNIWSTEV